MTPRCSEGIAVGAGAIHLSAVNRAIDLAGGSGRGESTIVAPLNMVATAKGVSEPDMLTAVTKVICFCHFASGWVTVLMAGRLPALGRKKRSSAPLNIGQAMKRKGGAPAACAWRNGHGNAAAAIPAPAPAIRRRREIRLGSADRDPVGGGGKRCLIGKPSLY